MKASVPCPVEHRESFLRKLPGLAAGHRVETIDGVKVHGDGGWVLIRPSGTEAIARIYAEGRTREIAEAMRDLGERLAREALT
jgi:phosphomannomutase